ncbi:rod shape-determining protein RodA [Enterobacteriaceae endosymbiont of Macroplea mutica]|uniref:rod shape-determining protein RodA n=1 Tax=Enterobacteriaceae endosymbiont of Macroplea mutica TaxID=2675791 RepID=UPI001448B724|nr:rod shape-determining protein RodA [Enterobacteriaceae endosymbiont of Macroplea mutica]QJC31313.1 rod shape-determining protein RodA [Enterobacteriaceae endosymbiont of Macroplea mutica]
MYKQNILNYIHKKLHIDIVFMFLISLLLFFSIFAIWSASGQNKNILYNKIIQICIGFIIMLLVAQIPPNFFFKNIFILYIIFIILLLVVYFTGIPINGAKRWLKISFMKFQPSEISKTVIPLFLTYRLHKINYMINIKNFIISIIIIVIPTFLVIKQPDLGTAILIILSSTIILFLSGLSWRLIIMSLILISICLPILWFFIMHDYQRTRILILLNPEKDALGAGYHILQSKIAIGSGGWFGKGWLHGTQTQLKFLPEKYTDFIFSVIAEEFGFVGVFFLIFTYILLILRGIILAMHTPNILKQIVIYSMMLLFFSCIFINISMVSGLLPIVGIPLPLLSYGGTSLIMFMINFGIIMSLYTHTDDVIKRYVL